MKSYSILRKMLLGIAFLFGYITLSYGEIYTYDDNIKQRMYTTQSMMYGSTNGTDTKRVKVDSSGSLYSILNPASSVISGQKVVTTAGSSVVLGNSSSILSVTIKAKPSNTGYIYVGVLGVDATTGFILKASEAISVDTDNIADVYIDSSVNGEGVSYIAVIK